ncbi:hypothetical protein O181_084320 [Austropuccinia psidii MF-1]|uniref:Uncharacterized protein n=1 Tax=Austropuccinia psidii MF-1 TaxID=1389203 RepID=A0A9Q3FPZ4_9BASI|nr:hypothetical protein [Austropuccinia psidii MF-1]
MDAAIQSNKMDLDKEEVRPEQGLPSLPQERHIWRMPELPAIPQVPTQKLVQRGKRRGVGNMPKPFTGHGTLLLTHKELSGSGEDHITLRRVEPIVLKRQGQKVKNWLKNQSLLSVDQKKGLEMDPALEEDSLASTSSKEAPEASIEKPKGPHKKNKGPKNPQGK